MSERADLVTNVNPFFQNGVLMHLEVIYGDYRGTQLDFLLMSELLIGRDLACDIVFGDPVVSGINSKILLCEDVVYIEDLDSLNGTAISGMRIHTRNRLRSCDTISIGRVSFLLKF